MKVEVIVTHKFEHFEDMWFKAKMQLRWLFWRWH